MAAPSTTDLVAAVIVNAGSSAPSRVLEASSVNATLWAIAVAAWQNETECHRIATDESTKFNRVWIYISTFGAALFTLVTVPVLLGAGTIDSRKHLDVPTGGEAGGQSPRRQRKQAQHAAQDVDDPTPNLEQARQHLQHTTATDGQGRLFSVRGTPMQRLSEIGGLGTELYFTLLRNLGMVFCYLTVCTSPLAVFSWNGNFVPDAGFAFAKTSAGNLGSMALGGLPQQNRLVILGCQGKELVDFTGTFGWLDLLGVVIFMTFVSWFFFWYLPRAAKRDDEETLTARDYAVEVDCLPRKIDDHVSYEEYLRKHLAERLHEAYSREQKRSKGKKPRDFNPDHVVREVVLVRDYNGRMLSVKRRATMVLSKKIADYKGEQATKATLLCCRRRPLEECIAKEDARLEEVLEEEEMLPVLRAYVVLNSTRDHLNLLNTYRFAQFRLLRCCQTEKLRFHGHGIRVKPAPEPTDIMWVNQDVPLWERRNRAIVMWSLWIVIMLVSLALVYSTNAGAKSAGTAAGEQVVGDAQCDAGTKTAQDYECSALVAATWTKAYASTLSGSARSCFCTTQGYENILRDKELYNGLCKQWLVDAGTTVFMGVLSSCIIVLINGLLSVAIVAFSHWERPTSVSSLNSSIMIKQAVSQYLNMALIIYLVNYNYSVDGTRVFGGAFTDFDRGWYAVVGSTLLSNMLLNAFVGMGTMAPWLIAILKRCCCRRGAKHQAELLQLYTNPPFQISQRYAQALTTCFCTLTYSSGLPLLNAFAALYFLISYWVDKLILLRGCRQPPALNSEMPALASKMLFFAGPLHLFVAIFMFSHPCTFPSKPLGGNLGSLASTAASAVDGQTASAEMSFGERLSLESTWMLAAALGCLVALGALYLVLTIVGSTFGEVKDVFGACCEKRAKTAPDGAPDVVVQDVTWDQARGYLERCRPPASYKMERSQEFEPIAQYLRPPQMKPVVPAAP